MRALLVLALAVAACAPEPPMSGLPHGSCSSARLAPLIGQQATPALLARARRLSNATIVRVLRPGQIVTMEYRDGRLNANVDANDRVTSFTCG